ncbi:hypothetical protein JW948_00015 [bacterium]|nr:hypothetical protein [bacterium]
MKRLGIILLCTLILFFTMCSRDKGVNNDGYRSVTIHLKIKGPAYQGDFYAAFLQVTTDYAVWIEDEDGHYVQTLQITPVAVTVDSAHGSHIEHLPAWSLSSGLTYADLELETEDGIPPSFDGLTSASPYFAAGADEQILTITWDIKNTEPGLYTCYVEASNIIKEGDSEAGTVTRFEIVSEVLNMVLDLENGTYATGTPTANLTGMEADFD